MRRSQSGECHVRVYECSLVRYMQNVTSACQSTARNRHESMSSTRHAWYVCARASCHVCRVRTVSFLRHSAVTKRRLPHIATAAGLAQRKQQREKRIHAFCGAARQGPIPCDYIQCGRCTCCSSPLHYLAHRHTKFERLSKSWRTIWASFAAWMPKSMNVRSLALVA